MFLASVRHGLRGIARFSGRDTPARFWPYAFTLFVLAMIALSLWMQRLLGAFQRFALAHPERTSVVAAGGGYRISVGGERGALVSPFQEMMAGMMVIVALFAALAAAAVARRLHDGGRTGWWGGLPLGFVLISAIGMWRIFSDPGPGGPGGGLFFLTFCSNLAYLASLLTLIVLLAKPGTPGPNEFGPDPRQAG